MVKMGLLLQMKLQLFFVLFSECFLRGVTTNDGHDFNNIILELRDKNSINRKL